MDPVGEAGEPSLPTGVGEQGKRQRDGVDFSISRPGRSIESCPKRGILQRRIRIARLFRSGILPRPLARVTDSESQSRV